MFARSKADARKLFQQAAPHFHSFIPHFCTFCISISPSCCVVGRGVKAPPHLYNCGCTIFNPQITKIQPLKTIQIYTAMIELLTQTEEKSATIDNCIRSNGIFESVSNYFHRKSKVLKKTTYLSMYLKSQLFPTFSHLQPMVQFFCYSLYCCQDLCHV